MSKTKTILMALGSSGGHICPAVAVAERLRGLDPGKIHFVHSGSVLGQNLLSSLPYPVHEIPIGGLAQGQSAFRKVKSILQLPKALLKSFWLIRKIRADVILGTGGSVTGPVLIAGVLMGRQTAIWEGNAVMGMANRLLAPLVSRIFTVFPCKRFQRKQIHCAYPLRKKILSAGSELLNRKPILLEGEFKQKLFEGDNGSRDFPTQAEKRGGGRLRSQVEGGKEDRPQVQKPVFKVLILGGSQGSVFLNQVLSEALEEEDWRKDIFIYHQTGSKSFDSLRQKYQSFAGVEAFAFSRNIEEYYQKCDLIFSRAGAGAIWEAASFNKPLVVVPLTHSAGGHQLKNALELSSKNCVEMIREQDFNVKSFKEKLLSLKQDENKRRGLAQSLKSAGHGDGAQQIADWIAVGMGLQI